MKFLQGRRLRITKYRFLLYRLRLQLVTYEIDRKMKVSYSGKNIKNWKMKGKQMKISKNPEKLNRNNMKILYELFEREPG